MQLVPLDYSYKLQLTACVCKDKHIMSSSNPLQGLILQVHFLMTWLLVATE